MHQLIESQHVKFTIIEFFNECSLSEDACANVQTVEKHLEYVDRQDYHCAFQIPEMGKKGLTQTEPVTAYPMESYQGG